MGIYKHDGETKEMAFLHQPSLQRVHEYLLCRRFVLYCTPSMDVGTNIIFYHAVFVEARFRLNWSGCAPPT